MSNIIASNICYGTYDGNNWSDQLTEVSLAYSNSIVYLKFNFNESISSCDELKIKIKDEPDGLQIGSNELNVCISVFENDEEYINLYTNINVYPDHDEIIHRDYTKYIKNAENEYIIPTSKMINTGAGTEYIIMIGTYDNEYGTNAKLKVANTSIEGIKAIRRITYDMNTGNGDPIIIEVTKGDTISVIEDIPEKDGDTITSTFEIKGMDNYVESQSGSSITGVKREGTFYRFLGWSNKSNATESIYNSNDEIVLFNNIILYAVWEEYKDITYENNVLSLLPVPSREKIEVAYTVRLEPNNGDNLSTHSVGSITEYIFKGWVSSGQGTEVIDMDTEYHDSVTVYALWDTIFTDNSSIYLPIIIRPNVDINSYVVALDENGGTLSGNKTITSTRRMVYSFDCWSKSNDERMPVDLFYTPTEDITLYAFYKADTEIMPIELPIATKTGYIFAGWNEVKDSGINVVSPYTPDQHITLYAHYISKNKLKMHIYHNGKWHHIIM